MTKQEIIIKTEMMKKDITGVQLAKKLGISAVYVSDIIKGRRPKSKYLAEILKILEIKEEIWKK